MTCIILCLFLAREQNAHSLHINWQKLADDCQVLR